MQARIHTRNRTGATLTDGPCLTLAYLRALPAPDFRDYGVVLKPS